jgi:hypothetical protein
MENKTIKQKVKKFKNGQPDEIIWEGGTLADNIKLGYEVEDSYTTENLNESTDYSIYETVYVLKPKTPGLILG